jgi:hypothetical protein
LGFGLLWFSGWWSGWSDGGLIVEGEVAEELAGGDADDSDAEVGDEGG